MKNEYESFLLCFHEGHTDVYHNGLPLGVVKHPKRGKDEAPVRHFIPHRHVMPDGKEVPVKLPPDLAEKIENITAAVWGELHNR